MSKHSRITYLLPLLFSLGACDAGLDDLDVQDEASASSETFRAVNSRNLKTNPGSGVLLNTSNAGDWLITELSLRGTEHKGVTLLDVETGYFEHGDRPQWEVDDVTPHERIDTGGGVFDLDVIPEHLLVGMTDNGVHLQHGDFHNSIWRVQLNPQFINAVDNAGIFHQGGLIELRLEVGWRFEDGTPVPPGWGEDDDERYIAAMGGIPTYTFYYMQNGDLVSACVTSTLPYQTYTDAVLYRDVSVDNYSGDVTYADDLLTIGCLEGAVGKVGAKWGLWPDQMDSPHQPAGTPRANLELAIRMIRADYCATGDSWTQPGVELELYDNFNHTPYASYVVDQGAWSPAIEAIWGFGEALCIDYHRFPANGIPSCGIPACGGKTNAFNVLNSAPMDSLFVTRNRSVWVPN